MAGIGFQLKKILEERSLTSVLKTFGYSGILSSGALGHLYGWIFLGDLGLYPNYISFFHGEKNRWKGIILLV